MSTPGEPSAEGPSPYGPPPPPPPPGAYAYGAPAWGQPAYGAPAWGQPAYGAPAWGQPAYGAPGYGPPPHGTPYYGQPMYPVPSVRTNGLAIAAFACALAGIVVYVTAPVAVILGIVALVQIKKSKEGGQGFAIAGIVIGAIVTVLSVVLAALVIWFVTDVSHKCDTGQYSGEDYDTWCVDTPWEPDDTLDGAPALTTAASLVPPAPAVTAIAVPWR